MPVKRSAPTRPVPSASTPSRTPVRNKNIRCKACGPSTHPGCPVGQPKTARPALPPRQVKPLPSPPGLCSAGSSFTRRTRGRGPSELCTAGVRPGAASEKSH